MSKPIHIPSELVLFCDVDATLLFDCSAEVEGAMKMNYYGQTKYCRPHEKHIEFLHSLKERGYFIVVMSGNGSVWAQEAVNKLGINHLVGMTMMKPLKYVDDLDCKEWMGPRIYINE